MGAIWSVENTGTSVYNGFNFVDGFGSTKVINLQPNVVYYLFSFFVSPPSPQIVTSFFNKTDTTYCFSGCCDGELISFKGVSTSPVFSSATIGQTYYLNEAISSSNPNQTFSGCFELVSFGNNQVPPIYSCDPDLYLDVTTLSFDGILYSHCVICEESNPCPLTPTPTPTPTLTPFLTPTPTPTPSETPQTGVTTTTTTHYKPNPIPIKRGNECDVITLYPMGVKCLSVDPSTTTSFDGLLTLVITGGTPPYQINWENGSVSSVLSNLNVGEYSATVTDYYGDFVVRTTCVLESPVTTTTTMIPVTTTTTLNYDDLCLSYITTISFFDLTTNEYITKDILTQEILYHNGFINGQPEWTSVSGDYQLYWNTGITSNWVINGPFPGQFVNSNPVIPPTIGWSIVGTSSITTFSVTIAPCKPISEVKFKIAVNDPICGNDGSITINTITGIPPYQYSIDGGVTYQGTPIFLNLSPGNYLVFVKDSTGTISNTSTTLIPSTTTTYTLTLSLSTSTNSFTISLDNPLPPGASITFDLDQQSTFKYWKRTFDPIPTYDCVVTVNGYGQLPVTSGVSSVIPAINGCPPLFTGIQEIFDRSGTFTITGGNTITGTYTDDILTPNIGFCKDNNLSMSLSIGSVITSNCECCEILVNNPPKKIF